jgi:hypothetical protein
MSKLRVDQTIDKETRLKAHSALKRFLACEIDSNDYECEYPSHARLFGPANPDRAIRAIFGISWTWFDDLTPHKLEREHALPPETQELADRCLLFLESDREYEWREDNFIKVDSTRSIRTTLGLNRTRLSVEQTFESLLAQPEGDTTVWPFFRRTDYLQCAKPKPDHQLTTGEHA